VEGEPFNMTAVRSKSGTVKGFKIFSDNPFYSQGMKFITWYEKDGKKEMEANGVFFESVSKYGVEKLRDVKYTTPAPPKAAGYTDDYGDGYNDGYAYYNSYYEYYNTDGYNYYTGGY
jgi:hypothetical protein